MLTVRLATMADVPAVQALNQTQAARFHRCDSRLPARVMLPSWLILPVDGACWLACEQMRLVGAISAEREYWPAESPFANVFPRQYLRLRLVFADDIHPAEVFPALMDRVDRWQGGGPYDGRMLLMPGCDPALSAAITAAGFTPYHTIAHQPMPSDVPAVDVPGLSIRPAGADDVAGIADLMVESWQFHAAHQPAIRLSPVIQHGCQRQTRHMLGDAADSQVLLLAEWQQEPVGFFAVGLSAQEPVSRPALFEKGYYGDIFEVGVRGDQRRRGVGRAMFHAAWRWFKERHVQGLFVNYAPTNPLSSRFWPGLGFRDAWVNWWRA